MRVPFVAETEIRAIDSDARLKGLTTNLSRAGCFIETLDPSPIEAGSIVRVVIKRGKLAFKTEAEVLHSKPGRGIGLLFTITDPEQLWILEQWVLKETGESKTKTQSREVQFRRDRSVDPVARDVLEELIVMLGQTAVLSTSEALALLRLLGR